MATSSKPKQQYLSQPPDTDVTNVTQIRSKPKPATFPRLAESYRTNPHMAQSSTTLDVLIERLITSIPAGDKEIAIATVDELTNRRIPLRISLAEDKVPEEEKVSVKIFLEDYEKSVALPSRKLLPSSTVYQLKLMMQCDYGFMPEIQRCIIGSRIVRDDLTLSQCGVSGSGSTVYIYLTSNPHSAERRQSIPAENRISQSQSVVRVPPVLRPQPEDRQTVLNSLLVGGPDDDTEGLAPQAGAVAQQQPQNPSPPPVFWKCEKCTFENEPSRPGCEMCAAARPASFIVPENCPISDRERLRIEREREMERLSQQAAHLSVSGPPPEHVLRVPTSALWPGTRQPPGQATPGGAQLSSAQIDLLLRLNDSYQEMRDRLDKGKNIDDILARPELQDPKIVEEFYKQYQLDSFQG